MVSEQVYYNIFFISRKKSIQKNARFPGGSTDADGVSENNQAIEDDRGLTTLPACALKCHIQPGLDGLVVISVGQFAIVTGERGQSRHHEGIHTDAEQGTILIP